MAEHPSVTVVNDLSFTLLLRIAILVNGQQRIVLCDFHLHEMSFMIGYEYHCCGHFLKEVNELEEDRVKEYLSLQVGTFSYYLFI